MMRPAFRLIVAFSTALSSLASCGGGNGEGDCTVGFEGCACADGGSCEPGLTCLSELCVDTGGTGGSCTTGGGGCTPDCCGRCGGDDGCGETCPDNCVAPETCGGGGVDNVCGIVEEAWYDPATGLYWQNPAADQLFAWNESVAFCDSLTWGGHSDWRLPTISELRSLIRGCSATETGGACRVTDSCTSRSSCNDSECTSCSGGGGPSDGCYWGSELLGVCISYWSSSADADDSNYAWRVNFDNGDLHSHDTTRHHFVRCVR